MTLTLEQRLLVYKTLLKVVCEDPRVNDGMCFYLTCLLDRSKKMPYGWRFMLGTSKMECLPELNKNKKHYYWQYWAPLTSKGWERRIRWIEQAIVDVKKKMK